MRFCIRIPAAHKLANILSMLKLLLERILPPKPREETTLININPNQIREQSNEIWQALTDGDISAATLVHLLKGVILHSEIIDKDMDYQFRTGLSESMAAFRKEEAEEAQELLR